MQCMCYEVSAPCRPRSGTGGACTRLSLERSQRRAAATSTRLARQTRGGEWRLQSDPSDAPVRPSRLCSLPLPAPFCLCFWQHQQRPSLTNLPAVCWLHTHTHTYTPQARALKQTLKHRSYPSASVAGAQFALDTALQWTEGVPVLHRWTASFSAEWRPTGKGKPGDTQTRGRISSDFAS
jgi:hypothetical protein